MSIAPRPPIPSLIPESAPFTPEQRTWLNGLFAGMISLEESVTPLSNEQAAKLLPDLLDRGAPVEADDNAPWHDPAMPLGDRMKLADGKPLPRPPAAAQSAPGRSRDNPVYATFLSRRRLNKPGSQKETWHIEFDLAECGLDYVVGDSFGIYPANDAALVEAVLSALDAPPDFPIGERTLRETLTDGVSLSPAPDMLFQLISYLTGGDRRQKAKELAAGQDPDGDAVTLDVLAALQKFPGIRADPEAFIESLDALQPRVYSI